MKTYTIKVIERTEHTYTVEARSFEEAVDMFNDAEMGTVLEKTHKERKLTPKNSIIGEQGSQMRNIKLYGWE